MASDLERAAAALGDRYLIEREIGRGGMGIVSLGTDRELHREVAIKFLPPELSSEALRERFLREARIAAGLSHPNLVPIFDVGKRDDLAWFTMAYIEGESVATKVAREGPQPISLVRRVITEVAQGLAYAHARGVVHRDVKPDNILLERESGRALVTDFGIAKGGSLSADEPVLTAAGEIVGTARYMSPEQAFGEPLDERSDIFALGLVAWFMLTGQHAIAGASLPAVIAAHVRGVDVRFESAGRPLPDGLASALQRCVAAAPADRFTRMEELVDALNHAAGAAPEVPPGVRALRRDLARTGAAAAAFAAGVLFFGISRVDPLVWVLGVGAIGWMLLDALEHAVRRGVTWPMIRRAVHAERVRRREEGAREEVGPLASAFYGVVAALAGFVGISVVHGAGIQTGDAKVDLYLSAGPAVEMQWRLSRFAIVAFLVALSIIVARRRGVRLPFGNRAGRVALALMLIGWIAASTRILLGHASSGHETAAEGPDPGGVPLPLLLSLAGVAVLVIGGVATLVALLIDRVWVAVARRSASGEEWRMPRWMDGAGSWIFEGLARKGR